MAEPRQTADPSRLEGQETDGSGRPGQESRPGPPAGRKAGSPSDLAAENAGARERTPDGGAGPAVEGVGESPDEQALRGDVDELVDLAAQRDEYLALAQRTQADFENYRKRVAKESAAAQERGAIKLAKELLPALDDLDRALEEATAGCDGERGDPLLEGVRLVRSELQAALARAGIESFSPKGAAFDPAEHEAMAQQPVPDAPTGTVVEVFQPGYRLGASIIRPARVLVAA
jgi:molecular chaperone GrpE